MWQSVQRIDLPDEGEIRIQVDTEPVVLHKFILIVGKDVQERQVMGLQLGEAVTLHAKLGFAIEDYYRRTEDGKKQPAPEVLP